ncbi:MFS-type transporter SLC18B1-like [Convolutriloba macropyga]|uniref:MFS-type transporter SLC18B1-like n=1 Tax=Convolutriloba macropyga TaxID=536237 RepID=UPI003F527647
MIVSPYLLDKFGVGGNTSGYYFVGYTGMFAIISPLWGWLIDKGHGSRIYLISGLGGSLGFLMLSLPGVVTSIESQVWLIFWLVVLGATSAGGFTSFYVIFETFAYSIGFKNDNNVKLMIASLINACFAFGRMVGPILVGGLFMDHFGYYKSCLLTSALFLMSAISCGYVLCTKRMLRKLFFANQQQATLLN